MKSSDQSTEVSKTSTENKSRVTLVDSTVFRTLQWKVLTLKTDEMLAVWRFFSSSTIFLSPLHKKNCFKSRRSIADLLLLLFNKSTGSQLGGKTLGQVSTLLLHYGTTCRKQFFNKIDIDRMTGFFNTFSIFLKKLKNSNSNGIDSPKFTGFFLFI